MLKGPLSLLLDDLHIFHVLHVLIALLKICNWMWWHTQSKHREELNINEKLSAYENGLPSDNALKRIVGMQSL